MMNFIQCVLLLHVLLIEVCRDRRRHTYDSSTLRDLKWRYAAELKDRIQGSHKRLN